MTETLHIYTRVSTGEQESNTSIDGQKKKGIKLAEQIGYKYKIWNEGAASSSREDLQNRPVITDLLDGVKTGLVKHVYVEYQDRLSRSQQTWSAIRFLFKGNNIQLYSGNNPEPIDLNEPLDNLLFGILGEFASFDNTQRTNRLYNGKFQRIKEGKWGGGIPPYGYQVEDGLLVVDETEAKWVREIFNLYINGSSAKQISDFLLENGVPTKRGKSIWSVGSVNAMLDNTHYEGFYKTIKRRTDEEFVNPCPPIISPKQAKKYKEVRESRTYRGGATKGRLKNPNQKTPHLLSGRIFCGVCGSRYTPRKRKSGVWVYADVSKEEYWRTKNDKYLCDATVRAVQKDVVEKTVWEAIVDVLSNSVIFKEQIKTDTLSKMSHKVSKAEVKKTQKQVAVIEQEIVKVTRAIGNQKANQLLLEDEEISTAIIESLMKKREELRDEKEQLEDSIAISKSANQWVDWVGEFKNKMDELKKLDDEDKKKDFLDGVLEKVVVHGEDKKNIRLNLQFKLRYVGDELSWINPSTKKGGYDIREGDSELSVEIGLKKSA